MDTQNVTFPQDGFVFLPSASGDGVLIRREQIVGARPNGTRGNVVYRHV